MITRRSALQGALAGASAASLFWPGAAFAQNGAKRHALIIGADAYTDAIGPLQNAANDARRVTETLKHCGFETSLVLNERRDGVMSAARAHAARVKEAGADAVGFVYYAGHGAARADGRNYLIPIVDEGVDMTSLSLWDASIPLDWLLTDALAGIPGAQIIAIDACRNELRLPDRGLGGSGSFRSVRGIDVVSGERMNGFLSFATWEGQTAFDGTRQDGVGPYAAALAERMPLPGRIIELFDDVRIDVLERTRQIQEPMNLSRLNSSSRALSLFEVRPGVHYGEFYERVALNRALVVGCSYASTSAALANTHQDAALLGDALDSSGFSVNRLLDPDRAGLMTAVADFAEELKNAGPSATGVLTFSGYGSSRSGHNFLLPQGPLPEAPPDLEQDAVSVEWIVRTLESAGAGAVAVLIDCGRALPYLNAKAVEEGFAEQFGTDNVVLAYSTEPGTVALDGPDGSRFAAALADEIRQPERRHLEQMLLSVSKRVAEETDGLMRPFFLSSATTPVFFRDGAGLGLT